MANEKGWRDITSYSRNENKGETPPRTFEMMAGRMRLIVTRHIAIDETDWQMEMQGVFITTLHGDRTAEFAKENCLMLARDYLRTAIEVVTKELDVMEAAARMEASLPSGTYTYPK